MNINIFKIKIKKKLRKENFQPNQNFYWRIIFLLAFLMILASFIFGLYFFMKTNKETSFIEENISEQADLVRKEKIEKVLKYFSEREKKSNDILNASSPVVDPSL